MHTYATTEEILETYCARTPKQMASILSAAIRHMKGSRYTEPLDLIHQALVLMLDGRRNWPKHVEFGSFMFTIMRGIASDDRDCAANKLRSGYTFEDIADRSASFTLRTPSVEDQLLAAEPTKIAIKVALIARSQLDGDLDAQHVIDGMMAGLTPRETCDHSDMNQRNFESAKKRVMRKISAVRNANSVEAPRHRKQPNPRSKQCPTINK